MQNKVQLKLLDDKVKEYLPQYATEGSAGLDLRVFGCSTYSKTRAN